jgi:drug/metabolite transporter (DMT)-like permease
MSAPYLVSLVYLALFGSVIAFGCYLSLVGRIGAGRAAYATLLFPVVALGLSTFWEGYTWTLHGICGIILILSGNYLAMARKKAIPEQQSRVREAVALDV